MIFDIDQDMVMQVVAETLERVGAEFSEEQFGKIAETIDNALPGVLALIARSTLENWKAEAQSVSTGWGEKYANSIKMEGSDLKYEIYADPDMVDKTSNKANMMFAEMVERGMKSFDIKTGLLASEKAKTGKDGVKYIYVPMPVRTPPKPGQGKAASHFGGREMTSELHSIIKGGGSISGTLKSGGEASGLTKYNTRKLHSQYGVFMCVSENTAASKWIHPGVPAEPVYPSVLKEVNQTIHRMLSAFCSEIVKEFSGK